MYTCLFILKLYILDLIFKEHLVCIVTPFPSLIYLGRLGFIWCLYYNKHIQYNISLHVTPTQLLENCYCQISGHSRAQFSFLEIVISFYLTVPFPFSLLTWPFFDASVWVSHFIILPVVQILCLLRLSRNCPPHCSLKFSSLIIVNHFLGKLFTWKFNFFFPLCFYLLPCICSEHPISTCSFLCGFPCTFVWHLLLYIQSTCDFLWLLSHYCFSFISHPCFPAFLVVWSFP